MILADKLIELRKEKGWSQEDFAEKLYVSRQAISRWENGTAFPDAQNILRISRLFGVTADYLLNDDHEGETHIPTVEIGTEETKDSATSNKKRKIPYWQLIIAICFVILMAFLVIKMLKKPSEDTNGVHLHLELNTVKENEVAPSCVSEGSYDEVVYCTECDEELLRTSKTVAKLAHTLSAPKKENEVAPSCVSDGSYDDVIYCTECDEEIIRTSKSIAKVAHTLSKCVKENEVAPSCTASGYYEEVVYCGKCDEAVLRTRRSIEKLSHEFEDKKCIHCGQDQPSEGLLYISGGDGTCIVSRGDCTDENIVIPAYSPSGDKVTKIKDYAFLGFSILKSIKIPETVTYIGEGAFADCTSLESVNLPSKIKVIYAYTFDGCQSLKEITIPYGVHTIGAEAFADCVACEEIFIPASVTKIGAFAFRNFSSCDGTITLAVSNGWKLYDESGGYYDSDVDFATSIVTPTMALTYAYSEYMWKRY